MIAELRKIGLSSEEARIYLACLEINGGPVSVIAHKAGVHRVSCYHTLEKLLMKRLLSRYDKNGMKYFAPEPPEQIVRIAEEKVHLAQDLLPELRSLTSVIGFKPKIRFYEGTEGVEKVFTESLAANGEILGYTNLNNVITFFPTFFREYNRKKFEQRIKTRLLSSRTLESVQAIASFLPANYDQNLMEILLVNRKQFLFENEVLIFNNTVGVASLRKDELLGLIIESATFARTMRAVFDLAWLGATAFVAQ